MQTGKMSICLVALLGMAVLSPARAGTGKDCAPMGALPNYRASAAPERYGFQSHGFLAMQKDGSNERTRIAGRYCTQEYDLKEGAEAISALEIIANYQDQLDQLGAKTVYTDDSQINRSEEHTSELQSLMRISYAVFCLTHK